MTIKVREEAESTSEPLFAACHLNAADRQLLQKAVISVPGEESSASLGKSYSMAQQLGREDREGSGNGVSLTQDGGSLTSIFTWASLFLFTTPMRSSAS